MILYAINCKFRDVVLLSTVSTSNAHTSLSTSPHLWDTVEMHSKLAACHYLQTSRAPRSILSVKVDFAFLCANNIKIAIALQRVNFPPISDPFPHPTVILPRLPRVCAFAPSMFCLSWKKAMDGDENSIKFLPLKHLSFQNHWVAKRLGYEAP